nr:hypothetical protein BaRGS_030843 [Batillaria attramentaria]
MSSREIPNPYDDYQGQKLLAEDAKLDSTFADQLKANINNLLARLEEGLKHVKGGDYSVYTGQTGYLAALMYVQTQLGQDAIHREVVVKVVKAILASGQAMAQKKRWSHPLMYAWYHEYYLGAAHGLAGIFYTLLLVYGDKRYLDAAEKCCDVAWKRGLLKKGYGLCHGVAGNAYAFLAMFRLTKDQKYLYRACKFAEWCFDYGKHGCRTPDHPYSMFEGMAGTVYYLVDLLDPMNARFPAYEF